jgi:hypothetical protein
MKRIQTNIQVLDYTCVRKMQQWKSALRQSGRSFIYKRNKSGPTMEPCGIPHVTRLSEVIIRQQVDISVYGRLNKI